MPTCIELSRLELHLENLAVHAGQICMFLRLLGVNLPVRAPWRSHTVGLLHEVVRALLCRPAQSAP